MTDVVAVGTCNMDFIFRVPAFVEPDSEMHIDEIRVSPGGSAFNFTAWLSSLGYSTGIIASIGMDHNGEAIIRRLNEIGVSTEKISRVETPTGMVFISVDASGKRSMYSYMGANADLKIQADESDYIGSVPLVHLTGCYIEVALSVSEAAKNISFSPGALLSSFGIAELLPVLVKTEILFLNDRELKTLTGLSGLPGVDKLLEKGVRNVVITHGPSGSSFYSDGSSEELKVDRVMAVDTTGAGDSFSAGFLSEWLKNSPPARCLETGHKTALKVISRMGSF